MCAVLLVGMAHASWVVDHMQQAYVYEKETRACAIGEFQEVSKVSNPFPNAELCVVPIHLCH